MNLEVMTKEVLAVAALAGLPAHVYCNRHEPTLESFTRFLVTSLIGTCLAQTCTGTHWLTAIAKTGLAVITFLISLGSSIFVYRVFSHPLGKYPGPFWAKVSRFWAMYHSYKGDYHLVMLDVHKRYGDAVRIGPNDLSILDPALLRTIHGVEPGSKPWMKGKRYDASPARNGAAVSLQTTRDLAEHNRRRRVWDKAFTTAALAEYEKRVITRIGWQLLVALEAREGQTVDLATWLRLFAWDIMSDMAFGDGLTLINDGDTDHQIYRSLLASLRTFGVVTAVPWTRPLTKIIHGWVNRNSKAAGNSAAFIEATKSLLGARIKGGQGDALDVFHHLLGEDEESGTKFTPAELGADSYLIVSAGSDTTSVTLACIFFHLINHPALMNDVKTALSTNLDPSEFIPRSAEVAKLPIVEACIAETLRLFPAVPGGLQRLSPSSGDTVIQGVDGATYIIPPDTNIQPCAWALNRARWSGPSPETFSPQRFIENQVDKTIATSPFGMGTYSCVGKNLAMQELRLVLASLVRAFEFQFAPGFKPEKFLASCEDHVLLHVEEKLLVVLKKRQ